MHIWMSVAVLTALWSTSSARPPKPSIATEQVTHTKAPTRITARPHFPKRDTTIDGVDIPDELTGTYTPSWLLSALSKPVTSEPAPTNFSVYHLPKPTGNPLMYPDGPGDCDENLDEFHAPGPDRWKLANANETLSCFISLDMEAPLFAGIVDYDTKLSVYYGAGSQGFKCGIGNGYSDAACYSSAWCEDLHPYPLMAPTNDSTQVGLGCMPDNPRFHHKSTAWVVLQSLSNYRLFLKTLNDQSQQAITNAAPLMGDDGQFISDFSTPAGMNDVLAEKITLSIIGAMLGVIASSVGILTAGLASGVLVSGLSFVASSVGSGAIAVGTSNLTVPASPKDMTGWWGALTNQLINTHVNYANAMFSQGYVTLPPTPSTGSYNQTLLDTLRTGIWAGDNSTYSGINNTAVNLVEQALYAQMAQAVWKNSDTLVPFLYPWPGDCKDQSKMNSGFAAMQKGYPPDGKTDIPALPDSSFSIDGTCYTLLGAKSNQACATPSGVTPCCQWDALPGGDHGKLNGQNYAGLKLDDMIASAVAGWKLNGKKNDWNVSVLTNDFADAYPKDISSVGIVNLIPICDYSSQNPGVDCPAVGGGKTAC